MRTKTKRIRVLLVEDHEVVRIGLRSVLEDTQGIQVVGDATTVEESVAMAPNMNCDVILMDLRLPDGSGVEACREILSQCPQTRVIFLTSYEDEDSIVAAVMAGASGYLLKEIESERLIEAIKLVAEGRSILDQNVIQRVQTWIKNQATSAEVERKTHSLSPQQYRVMELLAEGKTNKEIANALDLSEKTVRNYLSVIFEKLQITRRTQAVAFFAKHFNH